MTWRDGVFLVLCLAIPMIVLGTATPITAYGDEEAYLFYGRRVARDGVGAFPALFQQYVQDDDERALYPSPIRLTTIMVHACAVRLFGPDLHSLQVVSTSAFCALLMLVFVGWRSFASRWVIRATTLLLATSPLHLAMARRATSDSLVAAMFLACCWLFIRAWTAPDDRPRRWVGVAAAYSVTFLAKEGCLVLVPISLACIIGTAIRDQRWPTWWPVCAVSVVPCVVAALCVVLAAGGVDRVWQAVHTTVTSVTANTYALQYGGGPWFRYVIDLMLLSPFTVLLYLMWLGYLAGYGVDDRRLWLWSLLPIALLICAIPVTKNVRYVLSVEAPLRLGAVMLLSRSIAGCRWSSRWSLGVLMGLVGVMAVMDVCTVQRLFIEGNVYDPVSVWLLDDRGMLP